MYEYISGKIADIGPDYAVVDVNGVGYYLCCSATTLQQLSIGNMGKLFTYLYVAEDQMSLYGFGNYEEREMFKKLIGISRIGKKTAISILSSLTPNEIILAVQTDNAKAFDKIAGMGRKTAQRLILELKEKVDESISVAQNDEKTIREASMHDAIEALIALGYDGAVAGRAVGSVKDFDSVEQLIKAALSVLSKH